MYCVYIYMHVYMYIYICMYVCFKRIRIYIYIETDMRSYIIHMNNIGIYQYGFEVVQNTYV